MKIHSISSFKNTIKAVDFFNQWYHQIQELNQCSYDRIEVESLLGKTIVWGINSEQKDLETLVVFPGFRTCGFFWDFDNGLGELRKKYRIFLVDVNGQPCLSDGNTPDIKTNDYGIWAADLMKKLGISNAVVSGSSFGGLVCLKLCLAAPGMVKKAILLNPGCLAPFSLAFKNLYYNLLPLVMPNVKNVTLFLDNAVFYKTHHNLSPAFKKIIIEYELFAIKEYRDKTQKPYPMSASELNDIIPDVYLLLGNKDILFPTLKSKASAEKNIKSLKKIYILDDTGHGIETSKEAMKIIDEIMSL